MATREPWECPRCHRILAPHMDFCDCQGRSGEAGQPAQPTITPSAPGGGISVTPPMPYTVTNTGYPATTATTIYAVGGGGGGGASIWEGVTILNAGKAA